MFDALLRRHGAALIHTAQQHDEFVASHTGGAVGGVHRLGQHLARAPQHGIAHCMALLIIDDLEAVEVNGNDAQRPGPLAPETVELFHIERPVAQLREHVVLAQVFQVGLGLFARRDVHQGQQHQAPVALVPRHHGKLHVDVHRIARQGVIDHLALLHQLAVPQVLQLLGKGVVHLTTEHA